MEQGKQISSSDATAVRDLLRTSLARNTRLAYRVGWDRFADYCRSRHSDPLKATPTDVADFLLHLASKPRSSGATTRPGEPLSLGTIRICRAAINRKFRERSQDSPAVDPQVNALMQALARLLHVRKRRVKALREHQIAAIMAHCDELAQSRTYRLIAARDAALIAVGFAGALRRSEICALERRDVRFLDERQSQGMFVEIRRSKTDQNGRGHRIAIPDGQLIRPVKRLRHWLTAAGIDRGPVFQTMGRGGRLKGNALSNSDIPRLVKRYASAIGLDPADYAGHSLRAGFVTSAAVHHARLDKIMEVTRHKSTRLVLQYVRQADAFEDHAGAGFL